MNTEINDIHHEGESPHLFWKELDGQEKDKSFDGVVITAGVMSRKLASCWATG